MARSLKILVLLICSLISYSPSYCETADIKNIVDSFQNATDLQRERLLTDNVGKEITASGIVTNAGEYDFFNTTEDLRGTYYQVITAQQKTENGVPYQVTFLFRDKDKASDINKGQAFQQSGKIIKISDERLQIALWIFCNDLTDKEKILFR